MNCILQTAVLSTDDYSSIAELLCDLKRLQEAVIMLQVSTCVPANDDQ